MSTIWLNPQYARICQPLRAARNRTGGGALTAILRRCEMKSGSLLVEPLNHPAGSHWTRPIFTWCHQLFVSIVRLLREKGEAGFGSPAWSVLVGRRGKPKGLPSPCGLPTRARPATRVGNPVRGEICLEICSRLIGWTTPCLHLKGSTTWSLLPLISAKSGAKSCLCWSASSPTKSSTALRHCGASNDGFFGVAS